jgi:hypothetical protein
MTSTHNAPIRDVYLLDRNKVADDMIIGGREVANYGDGALL